jgi:hypothetical protein
MEVWVARAEKRNSDVRARLAGRSELRCPARSWMCMTRDLSKSSWLDHSDGCGMVSRTDGGVQDEAGDEGGARSG